MTRPSVFSRPTDFSEKTMVWCRLVCPQHSSESWGMTKSIFLFPSPLSLLSLPPSSLSFSHLTYSRSIISCWVTSTARLHRVLQFTAPRFPPPLPCSSMTVLYERITQCDIIIALQQILLNWKQVGVREKKVKADVGVSSWQHDWSMP